jgi:hypothetical protein
VSSFLNWEEGELFEITYGKTRKMPNRQYNKWIMKKKKIPVQYARLTQQFLFEIAHGLKDSGHESLRRCTYAQRMLDHFGWELNAFHGKEERFRSKVYSPILQRQLKGVHDAYAPSIARAIARADEAPTIGQVTTFYLGNDPLDRRAIPIYRRNLVYIREARWHLGIIMGKVQVESREHFELYLFHHDMIHRQLKGVPRPQSRGVPPFMAYEIASIIRLELEEYFLPELKATVCDCPPTPLKCANPPLFSA